MAKKATKPAHPKSEGDQLGLERLLFFSDAVFAIAITLLALEIRLPSLEGSLTNKQLFESLLAIWPQYFSYVLSFLVIGAFWLGHHRKFRYILRYDTNLILLNIVLLMVIAFIPFPTAVIGENENRTATIFYALIMTVAGLLNASIWLYASYHHRLIDPQFPFQQIRRETIRALVVPGVFLVSMGLSFLNPILAIYSWLLIAVALRFV